VPMISPHVTREPAARAGAHPVDAVLR